MILLNYHKRFLRISGGMEDFSNFCSGLLYDTLMSTQAMQKTIADYFKTQPVLKAWLFGSFARGEETPRSDVFQTFKNSIQGMKRQLVAKGFAGRLVFGLKLDGQEDLLDSVVLNLDE